MDYKSAYFRLFSAISDAVDALADGKPGTARSLLVLAQIREEEEFINTPSCLTVSFNKKKEDNK